MRLLLFLSFITFCSCCDNTKLNKALRYAGENREELEKVLEHYRQSPEDELKLQSAIYLIENMPGHIYLTDEDTDGFFQEFVLNYPDLPFFVKFAAYNLPSYKISRTPEMKEDIHHITSDFLINYIDEIFELWQSSPWYYDTSFDTFKEHILPYRVGFEPLSHIMEFNDKPDLEKFNRIFKSNSSTLAENYENYIVYLYDPHSTKTSSYDLKNYKVGGKSYKMDCTSSAQIRKFQFKYAMIPCAIDNVPVWGRSNNGHSWNAIIDFNNLHLTQGYHSHTQFAKVYRQTYHYNPTPKYNGKDYIPSLFTNPFIADVTSLYAKTVDVKIKLNKIKGKKPENAYLCTFNRLQWQPLAWGVKKNGSCYFRDVAVGNVFLPVYYKENKKICFDYPFLIMADGNVNKLIPSQETVTLKLNRKSRTYSHLMDFYYRFPGVTISGLKDIYSKEGELLYTITKDDMDDAPNFNIDLSEKKFRYIRIEVPSTDKNKLLMIASISFKDKEGQNCEVKRLMHDSKFLNEDDNLYKIFKEDKLNWSVISRPLVIDFGKEIELSSLEMISVNDDNEINPGDEYELFYHTDEKWVSLGTKIAEKREIEFENVPLNALYWLRNLTKGVEERVFIYDNGKIVFY